MSWSYSAADIGFLSSDGVVKNRNAVRLLIQDTATSRQLVQDEEIDAILSISSSVWAAAATTARTIAGDAVKRRKVGRTEIEYFSERVPIWDTYAATHKKPEFAKLDPLEPCRGS